MEGRRLSFSPSFDFSFFLLCLLLGIILLLLLLLLLGIRDDCVGGHAKGGRQEQRFLLCGVRLPGGSRHGSLHHAKLRSKRPVRSLLHLSSFFLILCLSYESKTSLVFYLLLFPSFFAVVVLFSCDYLLVFCRSRSSSFSSVSSLVSLFLFLYMSMYSYLCACMHACI